MNRLRVRIGDVVKERSIAPAEDNLMLWIEDEIDTILDVEFHFGPYRMEYLGEYAWDIFVDDRKIGHAKAWDDTPKPRTSEASGLWSTLILTVFAYLALC